MACRWAVAAFPFYLLAHREKHSWLAAFLVKKENIKFYLGFVPIMAKNVNL